MVIGQDKDGYLAELSIGTGRVSVRATVWFWLQLLGSVRWWVRTMGGQVARVRPLQLPLRLRGIAILQMVELL